jgi:hypothetical protein
MIPHPAPQQPHRAAKDYCDVACRLHLAATANIDSAQIFGEFSKFATN